ncbi:uncharacterized protein F4822DRAFT_120198 [Hypoxylon trugodes]|uniref:uncharacterized protein n=1 Tax=Hypoxylon trugodes TaxID=326681 RepID=UPI0021927AA2|nr:uncharacterized protein F4822DRAFT_120198 [Hypoxylon trugodes]KAI1392227.1 hypothetical protein F4822DRAFT_120198 [Hypoxylon trugodes]
MLEPWDEVIALKKEHKLCADDVQSIQTSCIKEHGKKHPIECADCWTRLLNRIRDRYLNSASKEWFSGRRPFLLELDTLFSKAHNLEVDLKTIEQRIVDEKKEWYRDKVKNMGLQHATKSPSEERALQQRIGDRSIPVDQLASELREAFSDGFIQNQMAFDGFVERLRLAEKSTQARNEAYINIFFQPEHDPSGVKKSQKYIELIRKGTPIVEVISAMIRDRHSAKGDQDQKQALHKKLEELKRAKAAHELDKARRDKARQDRARAAVPSNSQHDLSPCSACSNPPNAQDFFICPLCQLLSDHYGFQIEPVIFCSQECEDECYELHMSATHECASDQGCVRLHDEDVEMDEGVAVLVFCRECVETLGVPSVFCSSRCFNENFQRHRDNIHLPKRKIGQHEANDEGQLEFDPEDRTRYQARRIEEHLVAFDDAIAEWQQKTGVIVK